MRERERLIITTERERKREVKGRLQSSKLRDNKRKRKYIIIITVLNIPRRREGRKIF
jgi:hypothetical protein